MLESALVRYEYMKSTMRNKLTLGLISEDEYIEFIQKEDTLWNLMGVQPNRMTLVKKR